MESLRDLDYNLGDPKLITLTSKNTDKQKTFYEKWKYSNYMNIRIMKGINTPTIHGLVLNHIKPVEERLLGTSKSLASTLTIKMIIIKIGRAHV